MQEEVPDGFVIRERSTRRVYLAESHATDLEALGFVDGTSTHAPVATLHGRLSHQVFVLPGSQVRVLWKRCGRGGLMEPILRDRYLRVDRFFEELRLIRRARDAGLPVAEMLALAVSESTSGWHRVETIYRVVDGAVDVAVALASRTLDPASRRSLLREVAATLRRFHGHGFLHGDLNVKNILWRATPAGGFDVTLIDLDPCTGALSARRATPQRNLLRLFRSYYKGERIGRFRLSVADLYAFVDEYFRADDAATRQFWSVAAGRRQRWEWLPVKRQGRSPLDPRSRSSRPHGIAL